MRDVDVYIARGSGPGGQHRNKTSTAVRMIHRPTGLTSYIDGRSQTSNKEEAASVLFSKIEQHQNNTEKEKYNTFRKDQVGNRQRSDKNRTYNFKKHRIVDHRTGAKVTQIKEVMNGRFDLLYKAILKEEKSRHIV